MNLQIQYVDNGATRTIDAGIEAVSDLNAIMRRFIPPLRKDIDKVFTQQGPGWKPLEERTQDARQARLEAVSEKIRAGTWDRLSGKLASEQKRVDVRLAKRRASPDRSERAQKLVARAEKASGRQRVIRAEFERMRSGESAPVAKEAAKLTERVGRSLQRAEKKIQDFKDGKALGQIANSIRYEVKNGTLEVFSEIGWAGIHNDGGTAGKGAKIPERKFLEWTPERIQMFQQIAAEYIAKKMNGEKSA